MSDKQHRLESALRAEEPFARQLVENLPGLFCVFEIDSRSPADSRLVQFNRELAARSGYGAAELRRLALKDWFEPEMLGRALAALGDPSRPGRRRAQLDLRLKDGTQMPCAWEGKVLRLGGRPYLLWVGVEVTEQVRAQEALADGERRFRSLVEEAGSLPVYGCDRERRVIFWNKAAEQLHGFSSRQALGRPLEELIAPAASRAGFAAALEAWFAEGRPIPPAEWESFHQDGSAVPVYATHVLLRNREDGPEVFGVELDLRERRRAALEQERLRAQFHQAQKMEAVGQLAGGVAHDFNNLLQVIYGFTNLAMNQLSPDSAVRHELKQVIRAGERAKRLVGQLLTFSRRQDLHPEPLEVDRVVREFLKLLKRVIGEQIEVRFEPGGQGVTICADRGQVEQVLMNLCLNARDAMRDGGTLTLATRAATLDSHFCELHGGGAPGRYVAVQVGDTGCGMNPEVQERLFEPFFTTKPVGQGTGLGLATVYGIVRQHRGLVEVRSVRGRGSVFSVYFPEAGPLAPAVESPETAPTRGGTETLLVVEDDTAVLHITRKLLEQAGYRVLVAGDGVEGLRVFEEHADRIALAILDVVMPRMGGRAAAEALARRRPGLPVIFTSGYDPEAAPPGASSRPHEVLIRKPFSPDELLRQIRAMLDARQP